MSLDELQQQAMRVHDLYDRLNLRERERVWTREEFMLGFMGDVGDLAKLVMAEEGAQDMPGGRAALEHELAVTRAFQVAGPATPSACRAWFFWNAWTAAAVGPPKDPSAMRSWHPDAGFAAGHTQTTPQKPNHFGSKTAPTPKSRKSRHSKSAHLCDIWTPLL
ncbi:hypothetical protein OG305_46545 [Streptomyces sp. NBC_00439]|nr:hypothetical protein [Streptomyces sp. NBC_00439]MCX5106724.1 hypothetical protein [Streptomyces sp. NBC_00439]